MQRQTEEGNLRKYMIDKERSRFLEKIGTDLAEKRCESGRACTVSGISDY